MTKATHSYKPLIAIRKSACRALKSRQAGGIYKAILLGEK
jgi:hypothetical protein